MNDEVILPKYIRRAVLDDDESCFRVAFGIQIDIPKARAPDPFVNRTESRIALQGGRGRRNDTSLVQINEGLFRGSGGQSDDMNRPGIAGGYSV